MPMRPMTEADRDRVFAITVQSFNAPEPMRERIRATPVEQVRVWEENGRVDASVVLRDIGHYFGGRGIASAGVSGVAVAPEARGKRLAERLVAEALREVRGRYPLSALYPATIPLYRRLGYELAIYRVTRRAKIANLPRVADATPLEPWDDDTLAEVKEAYAAFAATQNGMMERRDEWWDARLLRPAGTDALYRYVLREDGRVTGWMIYSLAEQWGFRMECRDLVWATPHAAASILSFVARHASIGKELQWAGPPVEPLQWLVGDEWFEVESSFHQMLRILDLPAAIATRGYDEHIEDSVTIRLADPVLGDNDGAWRIEVSGGKGFAEPAREASADASIGALAAIFSGGVRAREAARTGLIRASDREISALERMFAGPVPWTADFF